MLRSITVYSTGIDLLTGTFRVYTGEGTAGNVLAEVPYAFDGGGDQTVVFPDVAVASGQVYTFFLDVDMDNGSGINTLRGSLDPYAEGMLYSGPEPAGGATAKLRNPA